MLLCEFSLFGLVLQLHSLDNLFLLGLCIFNHQPD